MLDKMSKNQTSVMPYSRVGASWTRDEQSRLDQEINQGVPLSIVAKRHDRSIEAIKSRTYKTSKTLDAIPERNRAIWTPAEENDLLREAADKLTIPEMARLHRRTEGAIKKRLALLRKAGYVPVDTQLHEIKLALVRLRLPQHHVVLEYFYVVISAVDDLEEAVRRNR
jgi:hypothetical protein